MSYPSSPVADRNLSTTLPVCKPCTITISPISTSRRVIIKIHFSRRHPCAPSLEPVCLWRSPLPSETPPGKCNCRPHDGGVLGRKIYHGHHVVELHASRSGDSGTSVTFIYEKDSERLLRHVTGTDEDEVILQSLAWSEKNSGSLTKDF